MRLGNDLWEAANDWCGPRGITVVESAGWRGRGADFPSRPDGTLEHWTAGSRLGIFPSYWTLVNGRSDLRGPLCQTAQDRQPNGLDRIHLIADGIANHAGYGEWNDIGPGGNSLVVGHEIEWSGPTESFSEERRFVADIAQRILLDVVAGSNVNDCCLHREWALPRGRKIDTNRDGDALRRRQAALGAQGPNPQPTPPEPTPPGDDEMPPFMVQEASRGIWLVDHNDMFMRPISEAKAQAYESFGIVRHQVDANWFAEGPIDLFAVKQTTPKEWGTIQDRISFLWDNGLAVLLARKVDVDAQAVAAALAPLLDDPELDTADVVAAVKAALRQGTD